MKNLNDFFLNDKFAVSAGVVLEEVKPGYGKCSMKIREIHENAMGTVMGGAIFTLADYTLGVAANSYGTLAVTLNVMINYMKPGTGPVLYAEAKEVTRTRTTGVFQVIITDDKGEIISTATGTCYDKKKPIVDE